MGITSPYQQVAYRTNDDALKIVCQLLQGCVQVRAGDKSIITSAFIK